MAGRITPTVGRIPMPIDFSQYHSVPAYRDVTPPTFTNAPKTSVAQPFTQNRIADNSEQAGLLLDKIGNTLDRTSGAIISLPANTPPERINGRLYPQKFSEQVNKGAQEAFGPIVGPAVGAVVGIIGDPLNLIGGGEAKAVGLIRTVNDIGAASRLAKDFGVAEHLIPQVADTFVKAKTSEEASLALKNALRSTTREGTPALSPEAASAVPQTSAERTLQSGLPTSLVPEVRHSFDTQSYITEQVAKQAAARTAETPTMLGKAQSFLANAKAKLVDFSAPIEDVLYGAIKNMAEEKGGKLVGYKLLPSMDIHNQIDMALRAPTLAGQFAKDNGIVDVIRNVDNPDALDQYMIAKHAIELDTRGITTGRDIAKDTALVKDLAPQYEPLAQTVSQYSQKLLDYSVESGLVSKDVATMLKARYPDYVPFARIFNELEKTGQFGAKGVASLSKQTIVQGIKGSEREVDSPLRSLLAKTNDAFKQGEINKAGKMLAGYEKLPGNPFQLRALETGEKAAHTISFLENGVRKTFETTLEIANAAKSLNVQQLNILGKIFALPVRVARVGITGINLPFIGANVAKDQLTAFINADHALATSVVHPVNFLKSLFNAVGHGELYQEMIRAGGAGTSFDISRNQVEQTFKSVRAGRNVASKILYTVTHPGDLLRVVENIVGRGEEMTRIQQFVGTRQAALAQGMSEGEATIAAARAARENTVNFARRGEWGTVLNSAFLYLNASIQGTRTLLRSLKTKPIQTAAKIAIGAMFPVATATVWNLSDPERRKAYEDIADYEKQNNIIIVPPHPTKDENGKWNVIKIPMSQEINNLVGAVRRPIEAAYGLDPVKFGDFASAFLGTVSPVNPTTGSMISTLTPQAIRPTIEGAVNKSLFTGIPQVSDTLSKLSPAKQVKPTTSGTAIKIGDMLGVSPIKAEEFIKGTFGGVGSQALNVVDNVLAKTGAIPQSEVHGQNILDAIAGRFNKAQGGDTENKVFDIVQQLNQQHADTAQELKLKAEEEWVHLKTLPRQEAGKQLKTIAQENPDLAQKILDTMKDEQLGLSSSERYIKAAPVDVRAQYIEGQLKDMPTNDAKKAYLKDLAIKKILTADVLKQVLHELSIKTGATI